MWNTAKSNTSTAEGELTALITAGSELETLRADVESKTGDWNTQQSALETLQGELETLEGELAVAKKALADKVLECQVAAYDDYREVLETAMT